MRKVRYHSFHHFLQILAFMILFLSCHKEYGGPDNIYVPCDRKTSNVDTIKQLIAGRYDLVYDCAFDREPWDFNNRVYSSDIGRTKQFKIDNNGILKYYENGKLIYQFRYVVDHGYKLTGNPDDSGAVLIWYNLPDNSIIDKKNEIRLCNDTLVVHNVLNGGSDFFEFFARSK